VLDKTLEISSNLKLAVTIVWLVILVLNFALGIMISFWWKSWKSFKEDQNTALEKFFTGHAKEHEFLLLRITAIESSLNEKVKEVTESIITLFSKGDGNRDIIIKTESDVKSTDKKLDDHIRRCEQRDQCHDRRKDDR